MGDHIVRRGASGTSTRRSEPRPTAELSKQELQGLIREHGRDEGHDEPDLEIGAETPKIAPSASTPRMLAHTLRRAPSPDGLPPTARGSTGPRAPLVERTDMSTIEMPRVERSAATDPDQFRFNPSDDDPTRLMRHRVEVRDAFDDSIPPAENDFEADSVGRDPPFAIAADYEPRVHAIIEDVPRVDRELGPAATAPRPSTAIPTRAPPGYALRVLTITLAFLVAVGAGYLLMHTAS